MNRKPMPDILLLTKKLLENESELTVRQISIKIRSSWETTNKALEILKALEVVKERRGDKTRRRERIFSLK